MRIPNFLRLSAILVLLLGITLAPVASAQGSDWPEWRGPNRDGISPEKNLPEKWSPAGENLLWKVHMGGRSTPVVFGNRVYVMNSAGENDTLQERILCMDANTGKVIWEHKLNVFQSDVPPHRIAWGSPTVDPANGNVYMFGVNGNLFAFAPDGKILWSRQLTEEYGLITTHGGRTVSPLIDGELVIVSGASFTWGARAGGSHRFFAFAKASGETVWISTPGGRPYDTTYAPPLITTVNGMRLLISGGGDGQVHAIQPQTGVPVWSYEISKRGINTGVIMVGDSAIVSHGEENLESSDMGLIAAVDATGKGKLADANARWQQLGFLGGYSSPVTDGQRVYQVDNGSNLVAFDAASGRQLWTQNLGVVQRASLVLGDGKLYVGSESGKFYILRPRADGCDILDEDLLGTEAEPEIMKASAAISRGRVYLVTEDAMYAFGQPVPDSAIRRTAGASAGGNGPATRASTAPAAHLQVVPGDLLLAPGEKKRFRARLFDAQGNFIRETNATWTLERLGGSIAADGTLTAAGANPQAGQVVAAAGDLKGSATVRVVPPLPWNEGFDSVALDAAPGHWVNATLKYQTKELNGEKVLLKRADNPFSFIKRARAFMGPTGLHDYTMEADVMALQKRRQMGDAGIVAQRYQLMLFGNHQRLEIQAWQPETTRTVTVPFAWKPDTWYRMKLRVENLPDGTARARGKVWVRGQPEPAEWTIEKIDLIPNKEGSPGIYGDGINEIYFDNIKVYPNR